MKTDVLTFMLHVPLVQKVNRLIAIEPSKEGDILIEVAVTSE